VVAGTVTDLAKRHTAGRLTLHERAGEEHLLFLLLDASLFAYQVDP
jgi:hypothetical protein